MFGNGGIFCMYSYVSPLMIRVAGFSPEAMTLVILLAGLGMFVGNLVSGGLSDRYTPERVARFAQGIAVVALALILFLAANRWAALTLTVVCTTMLFAVSSPQQVLRQRKASWARTAAACRSNTVWATNIRRCPASDSRCWDS